VLARFNGPCVRDVPARITHSCASNLEAAEKDDSSKESGRNRDASNADPHHPELVDGCVTPR
jgi:hypothetical protein